MHALDDAFMGSHRTRLRMALESLPRQLDATRSRPQSLGLLANSAVAVAASLHLTDPGSRQVLEALQLCREALNALFECAMAGDGPTRMPLGPGELATFVGTPAPGSVDVDNWLDAFHLNLVFGDLVALRRLCVFPTAVLREAYSKAGEHRYLFKEALCAYVRLEADVPDRIARALEAVDPVHPDPAERARDASLATPQMTVFRHIAARDFNFGAAMQRAIELHTQYWSASHDNARNPRGFLSIEFLGLAVLARHVGLRCDVETPYLPMDLIQAMDPFSPLVPPGSEPAVDQDDAVPIAAPRRVPRQLLGDALHRTIQQLAQDGDELARAGKQAEAWVKYAEALRLLPAPVPQWQAATWLYAALGDTHFHRQDWEQVQRWFGIALECPGGFDNPHVHLRLGQAAFQLRDLDKAADELTRAYLGGGLDILLEDEPRYLQFLQTRITLEPAPASAASSAGAGDPVAARARLSLPLHDFVCARCARAFQAPELGEGSYGEFLLRSVGAGETRHLNALQDAVFAEVDALLQADVRVAALPPSRRAKLLHRVYGPAACDPDAAGAPLHIGVHGPCPACGSQDMRSWEPSSPPQRVDVDVPLVSHAAWSRLGTGQRTARIGEAVTSLLADTSTSDGSFATG